MLKGSQSLNLKTDKDQKEVLESIQEKLEVLGNTNLEDTGRIVINASKFDGIVSTSTIEGRWLTKDGKYSINLDFETKFNTVGWIGISIGWFCMAIGGIITLYLFITSQSKMKKAIENAFNDIRFEFN